MSPNTPSEVQQGLSNVRRSYRILYDYQRRVLDLARFIGERLSLTYAGGWPKFSDVSPRPGNKKDGFDRWAWDWLNFYFYDFHFTTSNSTSPVYACSVYIVCDTGYWDSQSPAISELDLETYESVENSRTKLLLMAAIVEAWEPDQFLEDRAWLRGVLNSVTPVVEKTKAGVILTQSFNLHDFMNAEMADQQLNIFLTHCKAHGINLPQLSSTV